jgi:hypothetical protein
MYAPNHITHANVIHQNVFGAQMDIQSKKIIKHLAFDMTHNIFYEHYHCRTQCDPKKIDFWTH